MGVKKLVREPSSIHEYESVRDRIKTGDVIAFSGRLCISHLNQWVTQSPYSHVAMDLSALFCSELVTAALQIADVVDPYINPSKQTPADVVNFPCFSHPPILIKPFPSRCKPQ
jgi:hypothetical protein